MELLSDKHVLSNKAEEAAATGAAASVLLGKDALTRLLVSEEALGTPGFGAVMVAGVLATTGAGTGNGAATGRSIR